ncbi:hypothetical protein [Pantoea sp. NGS-ED-1003]|uniref:hypothetical protein n=1 Tax=Pantoea sp. NGS-ED-1003 TaxID=1526743 RepID=UPI000534E2D2|nr:hypothetical protein [Pantoea sp. NGS-ED-1003]
MARWVSATLTGLQFVVSNQGNDMALLFGRVKKNEWEHTGLFANIVPVYIRHIESDEPEVCAANGVPEWFFDLVNWMVCNLPMPYDGFMFTHVKPIESSDKG